MGFPMVPLVGLVGNICTNLITNGTFGREIGANGNTIGTNGNYSTIVTNQWYHWKNPEHTYYLLLPAVIIQVYSARKKGV